MHNKHERRVRQLEEQVRGKERSIVVVDVRDLSAAAATARIAAQRAELEQCDAPSALIILQHEGSKL